jgi:CheY-specific phosphatase CheX
VLLVPDPLLVAEFLATAIGVLRQVGITAIIVEHDLGVISTGPLDPRMIGVVIEISGDLSGLTWHFPIAVTEQAASVLAPELELDPEILGAAAAELANMLTGRGLTVLAGDHVEIAPPQLTLFTGAGVTGRLATTLGAIAVIFHRRAEAT